MAKLKGDSLTKRQGRPWCREGHIQQKLVRHGTFFLSSSADLTNHAGKSVPLKHYNQKIEV